MARRAVEEKAEQLALTSKYKNEFLANMSHELRTPWHLHPTVSDEVAYNLQGASGRGQEFRNRNDAPRA